MQPSKPGNARNRESDDRGHGACGMPARTLIGPRPSKELAADRWVRQAEDKLQQPEQSRRQRFAARLTVAGSHDLRGRIKIAAFKRGATVAALVRQVLQREFGEDAGSASCQD